MEADRQRQLAELPLLAAFVCTASHSASQLDALALEEKIFSQHWLCVLYTACAAGKLSAAEPRENFQLFRKLFLLHCAMASIEIFGKFELFGVFGLAGAKTKNSEKSEKTKKSDMSDLTRV